MAKQRHQRAFSLGHEFVVGKPFYFHGRKYEKGNAFPWRKVSCSVRQLRKFWEQRKVDAVDSGDVVQPIDQFKGLDLPEGYKIKAYPDNWCYVEDPDGGWFKAQGIEDAEECLEAHLAEKALTAAKVLVAAHEAKEEAKAKAEAEAEARAQAEAEALEDAQLLIAVSEGDEEAFQKMADKAKAEAEAEAEELERAEAEAKAKAEAEAEEEARLKAETESKAESGTKGKGKGKGKKTD